MNYNHPTHHFFLVIMCHRVVRNLNYRLQQINTNSCHLKYMSSTQICFCFLGYMRLKKEVLLLNYLQDKLHHKKEGYYSFVKYKSGHALIERNNNGVSFTKYILCKLQLNFLHTTSEDISISYGKLTNKKWRTGKNST